MSSDISQFTRPSSNDKESSDDDYSVNESDDERLKTQIEEIEDIRLELMNKYP